MAQNTLNKERLNTDTESTTLYQKVQKLVLEDISSGILKPGTMLPSSRELAVQLDVSRKTIVRALEELVSKGVLESKDRVGIFVPRSGAQQKRAAQGAEPVATRSRVQPAAELVINDGFPDTSLFPFREFSRTYRQIFNHMAQWKMLGYNDPMGYLRFRQVIAEVLGREAGLTVEDDELCAVRGSQMALFLVANAVLSPGEHVAIETPGYPNAYKAFERAGATVHRIPVDADGIDTESLETLCNEVDLTMVYVTPRHQYPTTVTLSKARRQKLHDLSLAHGFIVVEDDFGMAYNFSASYIPSLSARLPKTHYIYIGTLSKIFAPGMRLGFVASSREIIRQIAEFRTLIDIQGDTITERAIFELADSGQLRRHIRRSQKVYKERLADVSREIRRVLGDRVSYRQPHGGLAVWIRLGGGLIEAAALKAYLSAGGITAPVFECADGTVGIRVGYASLSLDDLRRLLHRLNGYLVKRA